MYSQFKAQAEGEDGALLTQQVEKLMQDKTEEKDNKLRIAALKEGGKNPTTNIFVHVLADALRAYSSSDTCGDKAVHVFEPFGLEEEKPSVQLPNGKTKQVRAPIRDYKLKATA